MRAAELVAADRGITLSMNLWKICKLSDRSGTQAVEVRWNSNLLIVYRFLYSIHSTRQHISALYRHLCEFKASDLHISFTQKSTPFFFLPLEGSSQNKRTPFCLWRALDRFFVSLFLLPLEGFLFIFFILFFSSAFGGFSSEPKDLFFCCLFFLPLKDLLFFIFFSIYFFFKSLQIFKQCNHHCHA